MQWTVHIYGDVHFTKAKFNENIMQTCVNSFEAVSKATMASYGAFFTELPIERPETNSDALRVQNRTKNALFENLKMPAGNASPKKTFSNL